MNKREFLQGAGAVAVVLASGVEIGGPTDAELAEREIEHWHVDFETGISSRKTPDGWWRMRKQYDPLTQSYRWVRVN